MKAWLRLLLVTASVGGGFTGIAGITSSFANAHSAGQVILLVVFLGLYGFVTASGLIFVYDPKRTRPLVAAIALQIPWISSPVFVYQFAAAVCATISFGTPEETDRVHFMWSVFFGAHFQVRFGLNLDVPFSVGVNVAAVALLGLLLRADQIRVQTPDLPMPVHDSSDSAPA